MKRSFAGGELSGGFAVAAVVLALVGLVAGAFGNALLAGLVPLGAIVWMVAGSLRSREDARNER